MRNAYRGRGFSFGRIKFPPVAWIGICLAAAIVVTATVGNLLKKKASPELLSRLTGEETETEAPLSRNPYQRKIQAVGFSFGDAFSAVAGKEAVSVALNRTDGKINYRSSVGEEFGLCEESQTDLDETMGTLCASVSYVCGVFHPTAFGADSSDLFFARQNRDAALIREFLRAGGSDVVLRNLPTSPTEADDIKIYLEAILRISGDAPIGIAVSPEEIAAGSNLELLDSVSDFLVLDLSLVPEEELENAINAHRYETDAYSMRLMTAVPIEYDDFRILKLPE